MSRDPETDKRYDDPEGIKTAKQQAKLDLNQFKADTKELMALPAFRRWCWRLLEWTHVFRTSFTGNSQTFFNEGERNVGLRVFGAIQEHAPESYALMAKENQEKS